MVSCMPVPEAMCDNSWNTIELALLGQDATLLAEPRNTVAEMASCLMSGHYQEVLRNPLIVASCQVPTNMEELSVPAHEQQLLFLLKAVAHLQLFLQDNWTGPPVKETGDDVVTLQEANGKALSDLSCDGEATYHLTSKAILLLSAKTVLVDKADLIRQCPSAGWWRLRCLVTHQQILDNTSASLYDAIAQVILLANADDSKFSQLIRHSKSLQCQWHLEVGHAYLLYGQVKQAEEHFQIAKVLCGLKISLTGALGKRTRYQQTDIAQLLVDVDREDGTKPLDLNWCQHMSGQTSHYPKNVSLEDDTVLNEIKFTDPIMSRPVISLTAIERAIILAECRLMWKSNPTQKLTTEELTAYLSRVLETTVCWSVYCSALLWRSHLEKTVSRKVERAMMQTQALVDHVLLAQPEVWQRLLLVHAAGLPPKWKVEQQLAEILQSLGCTDSALEIYLRLEMWENVILCYQMQSRSGQAEKVIRERLAICETPALLCYLGDATREPVHYERAWEVSKHHNARSQRSLGLYYLRKEMYEECISYFQKTLALNGLQSGVWFSLGCAALRIDNFDRAVTAFRRCVLLDSDNFEAWNNLAASLIKKGDKRKACGALKEALRCDYENWKVWENYLLVCTDIGECDETVRAYHRLLDLKDKYVDEDVLRILVQSLAIETQESRQSGRGLYKKTAELFGRLTSKTVSNSAVWQLYSQLHRNHYEEVDHSVEIFDKALRCLQKAVSSTLQTQATVRDLGKLNDSIKLGVELGQMCRQFAELKKGVEPEAVVKVMSSVKLSLRSLLAKAKKLEDEPVLSDDLIHNVERLQSELLCVIDSIGSLRQM